jgi:hypothetical protein
MDRDELVGRLIKSADALEEMINGVMMSAMAQDIDPYQMLRSDGMPILAPMVVMQASCFMTISALGGDI